MRIFPNNATMQDVIRERASDVREVDALRTGKLDGRIRTLTREVPTSEADVVQGDAEGDVVTGLDGLDEYIYTLLSFNGVLKWDKRQRIF